MIMKHVVWNLAPRAFNDKYIIVRDYGDGDLHWSRFSSNDLKATQGCVDYGNNLANLPYKKSMLETKDVVPATDFKIQYPDDYKRLGFK